MPILTIIIVLIVVGVLLWAVNSLLGSYMQPEILRILNIVVVIAVVLWVLSLFLPSLGGLSQVRLGR